MAGWKYYAVQPFLTGWKRWVVAFGLVSTSTAAGLYLERLIKLRYSSFRGRTHLYGDTTVRYGWLDPQSKLRFEQNMKEKLND